MTLPPFWKKFTLIFFCTAMHWNELQCNVLHCTVLNFTSFHITLFHFTVLNCTAFHSTALHSFVLSCPALNCTVLHWVHSNTMQGIFLESSLDLSWCLSDPLQCSIPHQNSNLKVEIVKSCYFKDVGEILRQSSKNRHFPYYSQTIRSRPVDDRPSPGQLRPLAKFSYLLTVL